MSDAKARCDAFLAALPGFIEEANLKGFFTVEEVRAAFGIDSKFEGDESKALKPLPSLLSIWNPDDRMAVAMLGRQD